MALGSCTNRHVSCCTRSIPGHPEKVSIYNYADFLLYGGSLPDWTKSLSELILHRYPNDLSHIRFSFLRLRRNSCQVINIPLLMLLRSRPYFMWFEDVPVPNDPSVFLASQRPGTFYFRLSTVRLHATRHPLSPGSALSLFEPLTSDCDLLLRYSWTHESWCCTTWERPRMPTSAILSTAVVPSFAPSRFRIFAVACCDTAALPTRRSMH